MYKGIKCCEQQLRRVDKALSRAGDIAVGSWTCLSHRNLILAEDIYVSVGRGCMQYLWWLNTISARSAVLCKSQRVFSKGKQIVKYV